MSSKKLGQSTAKIALVGNPNSGKTTLFNALTGSHQRIGNYAGVTVQLAYGSYCEHGRVVECIDVPGLYSLRALSEDEQVALQLIKDREKGADLLVVVLDASNMERNLFLFSQIAELGRPMIVALTMTDMMPGAQAEALKERLGVDVIPVVAHKGTGLQELKEAIDWNLEQPTAPELVIVFPLMVEQAVSRLTQSGVPGTVYELRQLLLDDEIPPGLKDQHKELLEGERQKLLGESIQGRQLDSYARYAWAAQVKKHAFGTQQPSERRRSDKIDAILTHKVFGLLVFAGIMYGIFQSIYTLASPLMDLIESGTSAVSDWVSPMLAGSPMLHDLVIDGIIAGVGGVIVFIPQIAILFLFIAVLEGSGYLARAAFLMDKLLGWCGLNGRAFIPLLSSYACAIPGIMAARVMPDSRSRLVTILVAPLMSCSARLPVYVLLIGVFVEPVYGPLWAGFALFLMHAIGLLVAIPVAWVLNKGVFKGPRLPFLLELPRYQVPKWRDIGVAVWTKVVTFLQTAGTVILAMSILIWGALYFPRQDEEVGRLEFVAAAQQLPESTTVESYLTQRQLEQSALGRFGKAVTPAFEPAGFDWRLTTSLIAAFPAREVVVGAMSVIFGMGEGEDSNDLRAAIKNAKRPDGQPLMNLWNATSLMVFFALCCQCLSTVATIKQETGGWKWAWFAFFYMTILAYIAAVLVYQVGKAFGGAG